jgi:predicted metal-dependent peptidase
MNIKKKLTKARTALLMNSPFFGTLALKLALKQDPATPTAWTDGISLGYNPEYVKHLPMSQLTGLFAHEVMHLALCHHTRQGKRDHDKWNRAADHAINHLLQGAGFDLPLNVLLEPRFTGMSAEAIYDQLPDTNQGEGPPGPGEVRPMPGNTTPAQKKLEEQRWKVAVFQANQQAKAMGRSHGPGFERQLKQQVLARVDWRVILQEFVSQATRSDYCWIRPNPRYITQGIYLPGLYAQTVGNFVVALDTSGSVSQDQLTQFSAEITSMLETYDTTLEVIYADNEVQGRETFTRADLPLKLKLNGGGGTDFRPVFELVGKGENPPLCLVYLTDLCCTKYPEQIPQYPVLWVNTERYRWKEPPFGRVVEMMGT